MWQKEYEKNSQSEKSQAVKDAVARIVAEEAALTGEEKESRYQRLAAIADAQSLYRR